jgi:hypothetical protein
VPFNGSARVGGDGSLELSITESEFNRRSQRNNTRISCDNALATDVRPIPDVKPRLGDAGATFGTIGGVGGGRKVAPLSRLQTPDFGS